MPNQVRVQMFGGPMDGDEWMATRVASVGLPQQFRFFSVNRQGACWNVYETCQTLTATWDQHPEHMRFDYVGDEQI